MEKTSSEKYAFILVKDFPLMVLASATEPLRSANREVGKDVFQWDFFSADGKHVKSSSGIDINVAGDVEAALEYPNVVLVAGLDAPSIKDSDIINGLRKAARLGRNIGAVSTAAWVLADAGVLDGYMATLHWENFQAFRENFPKVKAISDLFVIDRNRFSCGGGTSAMDLMLYIIAEKCGREIAANVADQFLHARIREGEDIQIASISWRYGTNDRRVLRAIAMMEEHVEAPLSIGAIAECCGASRRQLERLFHEKLKTSPAQLYLETRMKKARLLLKQTNDSVLSIAVQCGFSGAPHFSKRYRDIFHETPSETRFGRK